MQETASNEILLPRGLLLLGAGWLITSWIISVGISPPLLPNAASYTPAVRWMVLHVALGLLVAWPLVRLSGRWPGPPALIVGLDLVVLLALMHVVVWPLRLVTAWPPIRVLAITLHLAAWTTVAGAVIAWTLPLRSAGRILGMSICLSLVCIGPTYAAFAQTDVSEELQRFSPFLRLDALMGVDSGRLLDRAWLDDAAVLVAGLLALGASALIGRRRTQYAEDAEPQAG